MTRPILVTIHAAALQHNYRLAKRCAPCSQAFAVIKANAYGHGLLRVATALAEADGFALLEIEQALRLRQAGFRQPILLLEGVFSADELPLCAEQDLMPVLHTPQQLEWLAAAPVTRPLAVGLKLNCGMNRLGFLVEQAGEWLARLRALPQVSAVTLVGHFATADMPQFGIDWQWQRFQTASAGLVAPVSLANSAAIIDYPACHADWVRPGLMLYGASPFAERTAQALGLQPAMTLSSQIIGTQTLAAGAVVGYGGAFRAEQPMRIGTVACGYADGYPRHAPSGTPVLVAGQRTRLIGRVSMDMLAVDLTALPQADVGAPVELWGTQLPIDEVATAAGTISYELMCAVAPRVPVREG